MDKGTARLAERTGRRLPDLRRHLQQADERHAEVGLAGAAVDEHRDGDGLAADLDQAWELLAEPIQTVMRKAGLPNPYERLKALTRGQSIDADAIRAFIRSLDLPPADQARLLALTPASYIGLAPQLARRAQA